jgi:bacterial/archaeal transporter family protein
MNSWLVWSLVSAFFAGATAVPAKIGVADVDSNLATAIRTTVILPFYVDDCVIHPIALVLRCNFIPDMALSGVVRPGDRSFLTSLATREASRVAPMDRLSVLFAILFAAIILRETLTWHQWIGGGLVLTGAVILGFK